MRLSRWRSATRPRKVATIPLRWCKLWCFLLFWKLSAAASKDPSLYTFKVLNSYPHDVTAFTEGLEYKVQCLMPGPCPTDPGPTNSPGGLGCVHREVFWESTGLWSQSSVRLVDLTSGCVLRLNQLPDPWAFGEGLSIVGSRLLQLVWQQNTVFSYNKENFNDVLTLQTELSDGWGMTKMGPHLVVSDGSSHLYFLDNSTLNTLRTLSVRDGNATVAQLNELEFVAGEIWANVWQTPCIARINPMSGHVTGWILLDGTGADGTSLAQLAAWASPSNAAQMDVLNGIAWDHAGNRVFVTGKNWPRVFQINVTSITPQNNSQRLELLNTTRARCIRA